MQVDDSAYLSCRQRGTGKEMDSVGLTGKQPQSSGQLRYEILPEWI